MEQKEHLTSEGLAKIVALKASMNRGLSEELKVAFPKVIPIARPLVVDQEIKNPHWLAGFTSGEGYFFVEVRPQGGVELVFELAQHYRDEELMISLVKYFGCGKSYIYKEAIRFKVTKLSDITEKVIPVFQKYPILGVKSKDFSDFCLIAELMKNKKHLTTEGLNQIRQIKAGMNKGRPDENSVEG
jgi:hypothetical protein